MIVVKIQIAGGNFVQHRREEEEVVAIYQRNLDIAISGEPVL
jgi:hypothetical protein